MSTEENKAQVRRLMEEAFAKGKPELVDELLDPDFIRYDPYIEAGEVRGVETVKENIVWFRNVFPDLTCTIEDQIAEGDKVVSRFIWSGVHKGHFMGIPPTGNQVTVKGVVIDRVVEGKFVESRILMDNLGMMQQLGVIPAL